MTDFILVPLVVGIAMLGFYKFFELIICRRERRAIIEKLPDDSLIDYLKLVPQGVRIGSPVHLGAGFSFGAFRIGCLLLGLGLGMLFAFLIIASGYCENYRELEVVYAGSLLFFGGLGLIVSFVVERILARKHQ